MRKSIVLLVIGVVVWGVGNVQADTTYHIVEFEVCTASGDQDKPDISGDNVVWVDASEGQLHVKNLATNVESTIATSQTHRNYSPDIDGDRIVWTDTRNFYSGTQFNDIYGYTISTGTEFPVSTGPWGQGSNVIDGDIVLWTDQRNGNWNVWGYDLSLSTEFPVTQANEGQRHPIGANGNVAVFLYQFDQPENASTYGYNLSTVEIFLIGTNRYPCDISGNTVVLQNYADESLYRYDLNTQTEVRITGAVGMPHGSSRINEEGKFIVWQDNRNGDWDILGYDLSTETEFPIATGLGDQIAPAISGNVVVWEMNGDIYGAYINEIVPQQITLITPNGAEVLVTNSTYTITWDASESIQNVLLEYSANNGTDWIPVDTVENTGSCEWTVPDIASNECLIRVSDADNLSISDVSDAVFSISHMKYNVVEFPVVTNNNGLQYPVVSGNMIVWNYSQTGSYEIYGYDVTTQTTSLIHSRITRLEDLSFGGNIIAWRDYRTDTADVYGYNIPTQSEIAIAIGNGTQYTPGVSEDGGTVAYYNNGGIYAYNIQSGMDVLIRSSGVVDHAPSVSGDIVVWTDSRNGNKDIYAYNLTTQEEITISLDPADQASARISGNNIVWADYRGIMRYDLISNTESLIVPGDDIQPDISGDIVVFTRRDLDYDIYGYDLSTGQEFSICTDMNRQRDPRISGNIVVWNDYRYDGKKTSIYGAEIFPSPTLITPNGGEILATNSTYTITWAASDSIQNVLLELSSDNGENWEIIEAVENTGSYEWTVPVINSEECLIRVTDSENSQISDTSDAVFTIFECDPPIPGDANGDCYLNLADIAIIALNWLRCGNPFDPLCGDDPRFVGHWNFNEEEGDTAYDSSGYENDGILINGPVWTGDGALIFDGIDDYVEVPDSESLRFNNQLAISVWVYLNAYGTDWPKVVIKPHSEHADPWEMFTIDLSHYGTYPRFIVTDGVVGGESANASDDTYTLSLNQWYNIVGTYDGSTIALYVDGQLVASEPANIVIGQNDMPISIGGRLGINSFNGLIDAVRIYSRALSESEIQDLYQNGSGWIDLAELVDFDEHATNLYYWRERGDGYEFGATGKPRSYLSLPYDLSGSYELLALLTIEVSRETVRFTLPVDDMYIRFDIKGDSGNSGAETATMFLTGLSPTPIIWEDRKIIIGQEYEYLFDIVVDEAFCLIQILVDNELVYSWEGSLLDINDTIRPLYANPSWIELETAFYTSGYFAELKARRKQGTFNNSNVSVIKLGIYTSK